MKRHYLTMLWLKRLPKNVGIGFWLLPEGMACAVGAKANVPFLGRHKK